MMTRYHFKWSNLSQAVLSGLCADLRMDDDDPAEVLENEFGAHPQEEFVRAAWPSLLKHWLPEDDGARRHLVRELRSLGIGDFEHQPQNLSEEIAYLETCTNVQALRAAVVEELILAGETEQPPVRRMPPSSRPIPPVVRTEPLATPPPATAKRSRKPPPHAEPRRERAAPREATSAPGVPMAPSITKLRVRTRMPRFPAPRGPTDLGPGLLAEMWEMARIGQRWVEWTEGGFRWWGQCLPQTVTAEPPVESFGVMVTRLTARTELARRLPNRPETYEVVNSLNSTGSQSAIVYDPASGTAFAQTSAVFTGELDWLPMYFNIGMLLQAEESPGNAHILWTRLGGDPVSLPHEFNGFRVEPDELMSIRASLLEPMSAGKSPVTKRVLKSVLNFGWPNLHMRREARKILGVLEPGYESGHHQAPVSHRSTSVFLDPDAEIMTLGSGVQVSVVLEFGGSVDPATANGLNTVEARAGYVMHQFGGWRARDQYLVTSMFLSHALLSPMPEEAISGVLINLLLAVGIRANTGLAEMARW